VTGGLLAKAIQIARYGPPSVLELAEVSLPPDPAGEVRFRVIAAAVDCADIAQITALLRAGRIAPPAYQKFPLSRAAEVDLRMERNPIAGRALLVP
jgi:NADPH:quinone reductase-like Zn-dependent oxidoreductase